MKNQIYALVIGSKLSYNAIDNKCKKLWWESVNQLYGYHYKADTRIAFHAKHANINDPGGIVVSASDTDTAVILLFSHA